MLRRTVIAALLVVGSVLAACASEADPPTAGPGTTQGTTTTGPDGFTPEPIEWRDCDDVECAKLEVPLDYDDPAGDTIQIYATRVPATGERIGALFINPGGPGASAAEFAGLLATILPNEITERFDIVGVDPRGVGQSAPVDCGIDARELYAVDASIDSPEDREALLSATDAYVSDCAEEHGELLPHVGTRDVARDMDSVRAAMGDEQLSFLGFSYGSALGQVYADLFPDRVRSMVLDGILELGPTGLELADDQAQGFETALARFVESCKAREGCEIGPDPLAAVEEVLALAEQPGGIPASGEDRDAGPGLATLGISYALYAETLWVDLDQALAEALAGDATRLVGLAYDYIDVGDFEIYFAVNCMDFEWPRGDPDAFLGAAKATAAVAPHFGESLVNDYIRCVDWPVSPDPLEAVTAPSSPPIVVVSTTGDPATPYAAGVAVAERLANGVLVTNEGDGHTVVANGKPCIDDLIVAYLVDGVVPEDGTTCP